MAMIQCPNCGQNVSDKAKKCIHCGYELIPPEKKNCSECGAELEDDATVCPSCGCPVQGEDSAKPIEPQKVEITGVKVAKASKKNIIIAVCIIAVAIIAIVGIQYDKKQKSIQEHEIAVQEYGENLETIVYKMLSGASDAETCGNLTKQVWYNAIYEERSTETDKYTRPNGTFVSDFNTALSNLFSDEDFKSDINTIKENQETVQTMMKEMKNPPDEYADAYEALSDFYNAYLELTNLAVNPSGSLQTFFSSFNEADTKTANYYSAMKLYLE